MKWGVETAEIFEDEALWASEVVRLATSNSIVVGGLYNMARRFNLPRQPLKADSLHKPTREQVTSLADWMTAVS
jgi:hypothetical protein